MSSLDNISDIADLNNTLKEIENLLNEPGYLYSLLTISLNDLFLPLEDYLEVNWHDRISYQELSYLLGILIKNPIKIDVYPSQHQIKKHIDDTYRLLKQIHDYYGLIAFNGMLEAAVKVKEEELGSQLARSIFYNTSEAIIESVFYSDSGAYDFQYWETAPVRYASDDIWMKSRLGFSIKDAVDLSQLLKELTERKFKNILLPKNNKEYNDLVLSIFRFKESDVKNLSEAQRKVLDKLSVIPGQCNQSLTLISDFNELDVKPLIKLPDQSYLIPINFNLARAIDESPYYWFKDIDEEYFLKKATVNRGMYTEHAVYNQLKKVFGEKNVFIDVEVRKNKGKGVHRKGQNYTDIDVLVLFGNRAIIIQAKSKKLTLLSRQGDLIKLSEDFKQAVQDAYEQGLIARKEMLSGEAFLTQKDGTPIKLVESLSEVYIITVTTDNYPALAFQIQNLLEKEDLDPFPIAINLYDLDLLTEYLSDPFDFLFYVNQRISLANIIFGSSEVACLGYHLTQKLFIDPLNKVDKFHITQDFAQCIDDDIVRRRYGSEEDKKKSRVKQVWKNDSFNKLVSQIKLLEGPELIDAIFFLYKLSSDTVDNLMNMIEVQKKKAIRDKKYHSMAMLLDNQMGGITYLVEYDKSINLRDHLMAYSMSRKYKSKANEWLALGSYSSNPNMLDVVAYSNYPWKFDKELEKLTSVMIRPGQKVLRKIGRNEICFCGSGKKYKRCHGQLKQ